MRLGLHVEIKRVEILAFRGLELIQHLLLFRGEFNGFGGSRVLGRKRCLQLLAGLFMVSDDHVGCLLDALLFGILLRELAGADLEFVGA